MKTFLKNLFCNVDPDETVRLALDFFSEIHFDFMKNDRNFNVQILPFSEQEQQILKFLKVQGLAMFDDSNGCYIVKYSKHLSSKVLLKTIFHELIHIHQMVRGDLNSTAEHVFWKNNRYNVNTIKSCTNIEEYKSFPWEAEAYSKSEIIFEKFMKG